MLGEDYVPDQGTIEYIRKNYKNEISSYVYFDNYLLEDEEKVYAQGYGLKMDGIKIKQMDHLVPFNEQFRWEPFLTKLRCIADENKRDTKDFEKVILIWFESISGKKSNVNQFASLNLSYMTCLRGVNKSLEDGQYDYFCLKDSMDVIPGPKKEISLDDTNLRIVPFSKETIQKLNEIVENQIVINHKIQDIINLM